MMIFMLLLLPLLLLTKMKKAVDENDDDYDCMHGYLSSLWSPRCPLLLYDCRVPFPSHWHRPMWVVVSCWWSRVTFRWDGRCGTCGDLTVHRAQVWTLAAQACCVTTTPDPAEDTTVTVTQLQQMNDEVG